jgi:hypothetical protein
LLPLKVAVLEANRLPLSVPYLVEMAVVVAVPVRTITRQPPVTKAQVPPVATAATQSVKTMAVAVVAVWHRKTAQTVETTMVALVGMGQQVLLRVLRFTTVVAVVAEAARTTTRQLVV